MQTWSNNAVRKFFIPMVVVQQQLNESDVMTCVVDDLAVQHKSTIVLLMLSNCCIQEEYTV